MHSRGAAACWARLVKTPSERTSGISSRTQDPIGSLGFLQRKYGVPLALQQCVSLHRKTVVLRPSRSEDLSRGARTPAQPR